MWVVPNIAVKYAVCSSGLRVACRSVSICFFVRIDEIDDTPIRFLRSVFVSRVRWTGDLIAFRSIRVCAASIRCSCVKFST